MCSLNLISIEEHGVLWLRKVLCNCLLGFIKLATLFLFFLSLGEILLQNIEQLISVICFLYNT